MMCSIPGNMVRLSLILFLLPNSFAASLEEQYNQKNLMQDRYAKWCDNFSRKVDYFVCKYQKPTDFSHRFDRHLVIHNGQKLFLFWGNLPTYSTPSRGLSPEGNYEAHPFLPIDYERDRVVVNDWKNRPILEFDSKTGRLFHFTDLLVCRRQSLTAKDVKQLVCKEGYKMENPAPPQPEPKPLIFAPPLNPGSSHSYEPSPIK